MSTFHEARSIVEKRFGMVPEWQRLYHTDVQFAVEVKIFHRHLEILIDVMKDWGVWGTSLDARHVASQYFARCVMEAEQGVEHRAQAERLMKVLLTMPPPDPSVFEKEDD